jgi:hypothetical protein
MDRVLGTVRVEGEDLSLYLEDFDFREWVGLSLKGGILASGLTPAMQGNASIAWSGYQELPEGDYCVKFDMEDGTKRFGFHRGKIERLPKQQAIDHALEFNERRKKHEAANDPIGFTTKNFTYGIYSTILPHMEIDDEFIPIKGAEAVRYSQQEAKLHESGRMYYAPLCYVLDKNEGSIFRISNMVPLVSEPQKINFLANSWKKAGIDVADLTLRIIKSDYEADVMFGRLFADDMLPVLDPLLDHNAKLIGGYIIKSALDIIKNLESEEKGAAGRKLSPVDDPNWLKNDLIKVVLPNDTGEKTLYGKLVYDEAENEHGTRYVVMKPVDEGESLDELDLVIPSALVSHWDGEEYSDQA